MTTTQSTGKSWTVTRIVEEKYEVFAKTREEAFEQAADFGDPYSVRVVKETAKPTPKEPRGEA